MKTKMLLLTMLAVLVFTGMANADVPNVINYQGYLTDDSGYPVTGSLDMTFALYDAASGGTIRWGEVWNAGTSQVVVTDGYYSVLLGTYTSFATQFEQYPQLWLEVTVGGETLSPLKPLASSAYTKEALNADTLDGSDSADFYKKTDSVDADTLDGQDSTAFAGASHSHSFSEITGSVTDAQVPDTITINYAISAGNVPWTGITGMPSGFSDGTDNEGVTTEVDPTVLASVKDGVSFAELTGTATDAQIPDTISIDYASQAGATPWNGITGMPAGFADDTDDTGSYCTPVDSVPYNISSPGYYCMTGDLSVASASSDGFYVNADHVIIDLNGFTLTGPGSGTGNGVYISNQDHVTVRNGTIKDFGNTGVQCYGASCVHNTVSNIKSLSNGGAGIYMYGSYARILNSISDSNAGEGIYTQSYATVYGSTVAGNTTKGIWTGSHSKVIRCLARNNTGTGIQTSNRSIIMENNTVSNGDRGIYADSSIIRRNTAHDNTSYGIYAGWDSVIMENIAHNNGSTGIYSAGKATIKSNNARDNGGTGIYCGGYSVIEQNTAYDNDNSGFYIGAVCLVKDNVSSMNQWYGFALHSYTLVENNVAFINNQASGSYTNMQTCGTCTFGTNYAP